MKLKGGYIIDEIFNLFIEKRKIEEFDGAIEEISNLCCFELTGVEYFQFSDETENLNKQLIVANNIVNRGNPTRASLFLTQKILQEYGFSKVNNNQTGNIVFVNSEKHNITNSEFLITNESLFNSKNKEIYECVYIPILIGQIQKSFLLLWLNDIVSVSKNLQIHCNESLKKYFELAFEDLFNLIENLHILADKYFEKPTITFSNQANADFSLGINENGYTYNICPIQNIETPLDKVLTSKKIRYQPIGEYDQNNKFVVNQVKLGSLQYFLNNHFRKSEFREGQLQILNRILQCKDVIGILPTGSGKSLTYQLSTLLQPGITIVVDPIRSLMRDQYDKLRENFIDKTVFINSDYEKEIRQEKEDLISKGKYQYIIVGPERFQIQEFRNYLSSFLSNNLHFSYLVIDEAHCISEWGHDFRYAYLRLSEIVLKNCFKSNSEEFVQIALTATASFDVMADIQREINVENDSILQPPDLDRNELHFEVVTFQSFQDLDKTRNHFIKDGSYDYWKERTLAKEKYSSLKNLIKNDIPFKIEKLNKKDQNITRENFWNSLNGNYPNAGIIYCSTKSDSKGNGAYAVCYNLYKQQTEEIVEKGLDTEKYLKKATYFGGNDDNSWENKRIQLESEQAAESQTKFMQNKLNLIVATKAFGMGLDKPNVRFTIHYSLPTSIEAFYQEAGRAGRDKTHSLNYILYSPSDLESNLDNIKNAHKGTLREFIIYNELLTEIKYEDDFGLKILNSKFQQQFPKYYLNKSVNDKGNCYIYINERKTEKKNNLIAKLYLKINNSISIYTDSSIISIEEAERVANELIFVLKNLVNGLNYIDFLHLRQSDGIETMLQNSTGELKIFIGFNNEVIQDLGRKIGDRKIIINGREKIIHGARVVRSAYNFCDGENEEKMETQFIKNLKYQYDRDETGSEFQELDLNIDYFKNSFWNIRNSNDTQRAMYRLNILGVIDDYTVDYSNDIFEVVFTGKAEGFYYTKLKEYLLKYLGETEAEKTIEKARNRNSEYDTTELRKCLNTLADFYAEAITQKRIHSALYVKEAIEELKNGENEFRSKINNYFASKYASSFYEDFGNKTNFNINLIEKYLQLIKKPEVNNPGLELDNLKHLIGSCDRYEADSTMEKNGVVSILKNISLMIIDIRNNNKEKGEIYWKSIFETLLYIEEKNEISNSQLLELINTIEKYAVDIEPKTKFYTNKIKEAINLNTLNNKLLKFNQKYLT